MKLFAIKDTRGRESHTLLFVALAAVALIIKFVLAGSVIDKWGLVVNVPAMSAGEFGLAFGAVMAVWLGREWTDKVASK